MRMEKRQSVIFRAWNGGVHTHHTLILHSSTHQTKLATYVHNFKFDTTLRVICFVYSLVFSLTLFLSLRFVRCFYPILFFARVCTHCTLVWVVRICSCCFVSIIINASGMPDYVASQHRNPHSEWVSERVVFVGQQLRRRHYTILCIHVFCKTNENILMSSLNIT